ncbi:MAG TPA: peptidase M15A [bacterium]|nr:peptidase M15A [bacterium]
MRAVLVSCVLIAGFAAGATLSDAIVREQVNPKLSLDINGYVYDWDNVGRFVLPGETLRLSTSDRVNSSGWVASAGELVDMGNTTCWVAPQEPGLYPIIVTSGTAVRRINAFVMIPFDSLDKKGYLKGVKIGKYPKPIAAFPNFTKPKGFIVTTPDNMNTPVSPHYTLGDFAPRSIDGFPKYTVLREELLIKLELLTDLVKRHGVNFDRFTVFSGYRPPAYNWRLERGLNSAHIYGGAADIIIDADNDGRLDDLNHDGNSNRKDAKLLASWAEELEQQHPELAGGIGWYSRTRWRGPFIHVDVRGKTARWHQ